MDSIVAEGVSRRTLEKISKRREEVGEAYQALKAQMVSSIGAGGLAKLAAAGKASKVAN